MKEDLHKDEFEDFFNDTFEKQPEHSDEQGWDLPSDKVWTNVEKAIQKDDDSDRAFIWWTGIRKGLLLFSVLLISVLAFILFKNNQQENLISENPEDIILEKSTTSAASNINSTNTKTINSSVVNQEQFIKGNNTDSDSDSNTSSKNEQDKSLNQTLLDKKETLSPVNKTNAETQVQKPKSINPNPEINNAPTPYDVHNSKDQSIEKEPKKKEIADLNKTTSKKDLKIEPDQTPSSAGSKMLEKPFAILEQIPVKATIIESLNGDNDTLATALAFTDLNDPLDLSNIKNRGFYIGLMVAPANNYRNIKTKGSVVVPSILNRDEAAKTTLSAGINFGYKLSKNWSFETGFNYSKISIQHNRRRQVRYTAIGEQMNNPGEFEKNYSLDLSSSGGDFNTDIALARDSDVSIEENDFITLLLRTENNISFGSIPLIARYQFGKGKLNFGLKAGFVNRFVLKGEVQIQTAEVLRSGLRLVLNDRFYEPRKLQNLKSYEADFLIGAGAYYQLNDNFWLSVEPTITRSLNPIFENQNFKTFPIFRSLDIGIGYMF